MARRAEKCPCESPRCNDWHVWPEAALQGVEFTEKQARAVVKLLDELDDTVRDT